MTKQALQVTRVAIFRNKKVRKIIYQNEWWFSIIDAIEALTETDRARKYWSDLKKKLSDEGYIEVSEKIGQLKLEAPDGNLRFRDSKNDPKNLGRVCAVCGKEIGVKLFPDKSYSGGNYFGKFPFKSKTLEYWECDSCYQ